MPCLRPVPFLLISVGFSAIALSAAVAQPSEPRLLSSCSHCWPLSGVHPNSLMASDGAGGTYVVWVDGSIRWRLQRLNADLTIPRSWPVDGLILATERQSNRIYPVLAADGSGGVYVAWVEQDTTGNMSAWLLRVRPDGRPARGWPEGGVVLSGPSPMVTYPALVRSGKGAAVAWIEARNHNPTQWVGEGWIRLAARDANGRPLARWPADGVSMRACDCSLGDAIVLAHDGRAGLFLGWTEMGERLSDLKVLYASELDASVRTWTVVSRAVPPHAIQLESHPELVGDGLGGAIATWADERSLDNGTGRDLTDAFAQRVTPSGPEAWTPAVRGHHPLAAGPGYQMNPHVVSDGKGGAFFAWNEQGPFTTTSGRMQHLDSQGRAVTGWPASGMALGQEVASLIPDLEGGAVAIWTDSAGAHVQRFESRWSPDRGVSTPFFFGPVVGPSNVRITSDGRGGAFMAWEERGEVPTHGTDGGPTVPPDDALRRWLQLKVRIQHLSLESGVASPIMQLPTMALTFAVHPVVPNPARSQCRISFDMPTPGRVAIDVFDVAGRRVVRVADGRAFEAGSQSVSWDLADRRGRPVPAGLYLVRVVAERNQAVVRIMVTR